MTSFRQLLAEHGSALLLDAASSRVQVAWLEPGAMSWKHADGEAGIALFESLERLAIDVTAAGCFVFCDGPGSILGIRTSAMALRAWNVLQPRPMYAYGSLAVVAHALAQPDVTVIADARRDTWHAFQTGGGLRRVGAADLTGRLVIPEHFRSWSRVPPGVTTVPYDLAQQLPRVLDADLLEPTTAPDAFLHEEPSYVKWTPQIHRAP